MDAEVRFAFPIFSFCAWQFFSCDNADFGSVCIYIYIINYIGIILMQKWHPKMASCGFVTMIAYYSSAF